MRIRGKIFILRHRIFTFFFSRETKKILSNPDTSALEQRKQRILEWINKKSYNLIKRRYDKQISKEQFEMEIADINKITEMYKKI